MTIVGFVPMFTGMVKYFSLDRNYRRFKDIFTAIGKSPKIIVLFTIFILLMTIVPTLNIYFFATHPQNSNSFVLAISYIALVVGVLFLIAAPIVITNMNVKLGQLFYNSVAVLSSSPVSSLLCLAAAGGIIAAILYFPYIVPLTLYPFLVIISKLMCDSFDRLKAKSLGKTTEYIERNGTDDGYIDENGEVNFGHE